LARKKFKLDDQDADLIRDPAEGEAVFVGPPVPGQDEDPALDLGTSSTVSGQRKPDSMEERLRRVEAALTKLLELQESEPDPQKPEKSSYQLQREPPASTPAAGPSVLSRAAALVDAGRDLLPALTLRNNQDSAPSPPRPASSSRFGLVGDVFIELQAIYYMYVDPRYRFSWIGRIIPLVLLGLFFTTGWWLPYVACGAGVLFQKPIELALCYALFKILAVEAKRYRETAPDLPTSLRGGGGA
jgi:hypothetical protein